MTGTVSTDMLRVNNSQISLPLSQASFLLASSERGMDYLQADGLLGLGMITGQPNIVQALVAQTVLEKAVFSLYLGDNGFGYEETNPRSVLTLGTSFPGKYATAEMIYLPSVLPDVWSLPLTYIGVGEHVYSLTGTRIAAFDVGYDMLVLNEPEYYWVVGLISEGRNCRIDEYSSYTYCDCLANYAITDYPPMHLHLGAIGVTLTPQQYFYVVGGM